MPEPLARCGPFYYQISEMFSEVVEVLRMENSEEITVGFLYLSSGEFECEATVLAGDMPSLAELVYHAQTTEKFEPPFKKKRKK